MRRVKRKSPETGTAVTQLRGPAVPGSMQTLLPAEDGQLRLYRQLRECVPILDAAIGKLVRLVGGVRLEASDPAAQAALDEFIRSVPCGRGQQGLESFLSAYLNVLFTYGRAVGEVVVSGGRAAALNWGDPALVEIREGESPLDVELWAWQEGRMQKLPGQELLLLTTLNPEPDHPYGVSLLRSLPALGQVLTQIFATIGRNWKRAGDLKYSVVYKPGDNTDRLGAKERSQQMASQWAQAMQDGMNGEVRDFVAVGDVEIKVIGADGPILDAQTPVRLIMEQLVAKTGLPPFLLGLSWSSTERMAAQQADLLTSELWAVRRAVTPALERIGDLWLRLEGWGGRVTAVWDDIDLLDTLDEAKADYYRAQTQRLLGEKREEQGYADL